jgi:hypothetical protein
MLTGGEQKFTSFWSWAGAIGNTAVVHIETVTQMRVIVERSPPPNVEKYECGRGRLPSGHGILRDASRVSD